MPFWANKKRFEALNEKKASKKTKDGMMLAYHTLRKLNDERNNQTANGKEEDSVPEIPESGVER